MDKNLKQILLISFIFIALLIKNGWDYTSKILGYIGVVFKGIIVGMEITAEFYGTSLLEILFTLLISFPIVGYMLRKLDIPKGKAGHFIGAIFYAIVSFIVGNLLSFFVILFFSLFFTLSSHLPPIMVL